MSQSLSHSAVQSPMPVYLCLCVCVCVCVCVCDSVHQEVGSALDQKQKDLFDVSELGGMLSQAGAARLVEPSLLRLNRRWEEAELKIAHFRRQLVSVP